MAVPVTAVTLVVDLTDSIVAFHRQLPGPDAFLPLVEPGAKVGEPATHPGQSLVRHTPGLGPGLGRFQTISTGDPFGEQSHWHGLRSTGHWRRSRQLFVRVERPDRIDSRRS